MNNLGMVAVLLFILSVFPRIAPAQGVWTSYPDTLEIRDMTLRGDYLWCATNGGIVRYDTRDMSRRVYTTADGLPGETWSITAGRDGTMWASAYGPMGPSSEWILCRLQDERWEPHRTLDTNSFPWNAISWHCGPRHIEADSGGNLWMGSVWGIRPNDSLFTVNAPSVGSIADEYLWYLQSDRFGTLWAGTLYAHHSYRHSYFFRFNGTGWENYFFYTNLWADIIVPVVAGLGGVVWFYEHYEVLGEGMNERLVRFDGRETVYFPYSETGISGKTVCGNYGPGGMVWFGTDAGAVYLFDGGGWKGYTPASDHLFESAVKAIETAPNGVVWVGTDRGISRFVPEFLSVGETVARPVAVRIDGNIPNPFNPSTTITFSLPYPGRAELSVYSITGQRVRTLLSVPMDAGTHSAVWDGRDDSGKAVSSGVYLTQLRSGKQVSSGKMLLMK